MEINKFLMMALATLAFASCGNDDSTSGVEEKKEEGALIETLRVSFVDSKTTYADEGEEDGLDEENEVRRAFVFAKEAAPGHAGPRTGDWTVKEVTNEGNVLVGGTTGNPDEIQKTLNNAAMFSGVRMGDSVYVIANPGSTFDLAAAQTMAHNAEKSEATIRAYIQKIEKKYLTMNSHTTHKSTVGINNKPSGESFFMAGAGVIPTSPTVANGATVTVPVSLDRELAKVFYQVSVTADTKYTACGKVELKLGDGFLVVRGAKETAPFSKQASGFYYPTPDTDQDKDWNVTDSLKVFDGTGKGGGATTDFNYFPYIAPGATESKSKEFRFTFAARHTNHSPSYGTDTHPVNDTGAVAYLQDGFLYSPWFYVNPNYSDNAGCATAICTQATYTGNTVLIDKVTQEMIAHALADATVGALIGKKETINGIEVNVLKADAWDTESNITAFLTLIQKDVNFKKVITTEKYKTAASITECKNGDKRFYRADIANYSADNTTSLKNTERNTIYRIRGTITTLGAKSIEDAINSDDISMLVQVKVNKWKVKFTDINM